MNGHKDVACCLLQNGADGSLRHKTRRAVLHLAMRDYRENTVRILRESEADTIYVADFIISAINPETKDLRKV